MAANFAGKTALITGAGRGIGRAVALGLGAAGARVILLARTTAQLEETRALLREPRRVSILPAGPEPRRAAPPAPRRQPASATGRRSSAGTVRSGRVPIVSNGTTDRFTHAVRIPAAPAITGDGLNARTSSTLICWAKKPARPLLARQLPIIAGVPLEKALTAVHRACLVSASRR